jgi:hypothetical protein
VDGLLDRIAILKGARGAREQELQDMAINFRKVALPVAVVTAVAVSASDFNKCANIRSDLPVPHTLLTQHKVEVLVMQV